MDILELKCLIENHLEYTGSTVAQHILSNWEDEIRHFVKVMPTDYKRVLMEMVEEDSRTAAVAS